MKLSEFDYILPQKLIAATPTKKRDESKLMLLDKKTGKIDHRHFSDLIDFLNPGDILVLNESKVFPARLIGQKENGGTAEILLDHELDDGVWQGIGKKIRTGQKICFSGSDLCGEVLKQSEQEITIKFNQAGQQLFSSLEITGQTPLPPYILNARKNKQPDKNDKSRYQTVFAKNIGSSAAPTAGLHFTKKLLEKIATKGVKICYLTLHVGLGTFMPIQVDEIKNHKMHKEFFCLGGNVINSIITAKKNHKKIVAVGTTTTRVLEHVFSQIEKDKDLADQKQICGWTDIFIYPGYKFKCIDSLVTNFHLPKSTLLLLVSALAGQKKILNAYDVAIQNHYRFYSYGDAMFIR